jgi:uncharacterized membrane protein YdfJ with MMPL/SSD domain
VSPIDFADGVRIADLTLTMLAVGAVTMYIYRYTQRYRREVLQRRRLTVTWVSSLSFLALLLAGAYVDIARFGLVLSPVTPLHLLGVVGALISTYLVAISDYAEL